MFLGRRLDLKHNFSRMHAKAVLFGIDFANPPCREAAFDCRPDQDREIRLMFTWFKSKKNDNVHKLIWQNQVAAKFLMTYFEGTARKPNFLGGVERIHGQSLSLRIFDERIEKMPPQMQFGWMSDNKFLRKIYDATIFAKLKSFDETFSNM